MHTALLRGLSAALLTVLSLTTAPSALAAETVPLTEAVASLPLATESRDGYTREAFKHWNSGDDPADGCTTRNEVLIAEAVTAPTVGARCALSGGVWWSYYDEQTVTAASGLDIDHMVPLAEAWDSGAFAWSAQRREAYANDLGQDASLVAVTARSNLAAAVTGALALRRTLQRRRRAVQSRQGPRPVAPASGPVRLGMDRHQTPLEPGRRPTRTRPTGGHRRRLRRLHRHLHPRPVRTRRSARSSRAVRPREKGACRPFPMSSFLSCSVARLRAGRLPA